MNEFLLVLAAILPAAVLCIYVFKKDRVEKEPIKLLFLLLFAGVLSCIPAALGEELVQGIINNAFSIKTMAVKTDAGITFTKTYYVYMFLKTFVGIALIEELAKFVMLIWLTSKSKEFNSLFDGIIYAVFVSLGFAAFENVLYVLELGFQTAVGRAILSVPGHMFFGVMMGYYYSFCHIIHKAGGVEKKLKKQGIISPEKSAFKLGNNLFMCILMPTLAHGMYDYCCMLRVGWAVLAFYLFVAFLYFHCFGKIRKMSAADAYERDYVKALIDKIYPGALQNMGEGNVEIKDEMLENIQK